MGKNHLRRVVLILSHVSTIVGGILSKDSNVGSSMLTSSSRLLLLATTAVSRLTRLIGTLSLMMICFICKIVCLVPSLVRILRLLVELQDRDYCLLMRCSSNLASRQACRLNGPPWIWLWVLVEVSLQLWLPYKKNVQVDYLMVRSKFLSNPRANPAHTVLKVRKSKVLQIPARTRKCWVLRKHWGEIVNATKWLMQVVEWFMRVPEWILWIGEWTR